MEDDDWGLQAVVRSCGGATSTAVGGGDPFCALPPPHLLKGSGDLVVKDELCFFSPEIFDLRTAFEELEELCRPFFSKSAQQQLQQRLELPSSSPSSGEALGLPGGGAAALGGPQQQILPRHPRQRQLSHATSTRSKRRKNQLKRVVCQVPADGLSSDMWAWRKYGQKPIKGSPFPRGYYKCSSSKGCPARKQVERSRTDPGMFILTYTSDHNHPVPTHRNCLAGSTRYKSPPPSTTTPADGASGEADAFQVSTSVALSCSQLSSPTAQSSSIEKLGTPDKEEDEVAGEEDDEEEEGLLLVNDMEMLAYDDVLFMGLDELNHHQQTPPSSANQFPSSLSPSPWTKSSSSSTVAAAGGAVR